MKNIEYPNLKDIELEIKEISEFYENKISKMSDDESELFSKGFYKFINATKELAIKYNLNPDSVSEHYKAEIFLKMAKANK